MGLPIIDEIRSILEFFVNNIPKPLQILLLVIIAGFIMGIGVPTIYELTTDYTCADDVVYFDTGRCDATLTIYDYYTEGSNISIFDKAFTFVYVWTQEVQFIDADGSVINPDEMRQYERSYWVDIACQVIPTDANGDLIVDLETGDVATVFYPICEGDKVRPSLKGNDIFDTKNFVVLMLLIYFVMLVFYLFKN